jgi:drug/metabolite transporter (DMT)-like permease
MKLETYSEILMETSIISATFLFATGWYWYYQGEDIGWNLILGAIMVVGVIINAIIVWECRHGSLSKHLVER